MMKLKGKVIVITGGSSGIGKAAAKLLVQEGATLALLARDKGKLENARKEIGYAPEDNAQTYA